MSDTEQDPAKPATDPPNDPPKDPKTINGIATTQTSLISPLQDPAAIAERKERKKLLAQTAIGIAPPALGSKQPPAAPASVRPPPSKAPIGLPSGGSRPPPSVSGPPSKPPTSQSKAPLSKPPISASQTPSRPPIAPSAPKVPVAAPVPSFHDEPAPPTAPYADTIIAGPAVKPAEPPKSPSKPPDPIRDTARSPSANIKLGNTLIGTSAPPMPLPTPPMPVVEPTREAVKEAAKPVMTPIPGPSKIVPRRRTPPKGFPAAAPIPSKEDSPKITPAAGAPADAAMRPTVAAKPATPPAVAVKPSIVPPVIRIPGAGAIQTKQDGTLLCEILVRMGSVSQEKVDEAIALQEERGGQIGRILVQLGACTEDAIARALIEQLKTRKDGGYVLRDASAAAREKKEVAGLKVLTRPTRTVAVLFLTDLFSLSLAALLATSVHWFRTYGELQEIDWTAWLVVGPSVALCMLTYLGLELYSPMAKSTPDEIRDITFSSSLVHFGASILSTLGDLPIVKWGVFVRAVWWAATLFLVPIIRATVRNWFSVQPWWGIPVVVLGAAKTGRLVVRTLRAQPRSGLKPVMLLDDDKSKLGTLRASFTNEVMDVYSVNLASSHFLSDEQRAAFSQDIFGDVAPISSDHIPVAAPVGTIDIENAPVPVVSGTHPPSGSKPPSERVTFRKSSEFFNPESARLSHAPMSKDASQFPRGKFAEVDGVPIVGDLSLAPILAQRLKIPYAVMAMPGLDSPKLLQIVERIGGQFTHLLIIPDLFGFASMGVPAKNLGGILGVEVRQQLLLPGPRLAKRIMDTVLTGIGSLFVLPFLLLIALMVKLDSKGPIFYWQNRLGKDGTYFKAYKFRTMHGDGEARLKAILEADPVLKAEYDIYHKLKKDPRVTRIGRFLRKFSLDEFPQLWNVINGDMSLVGPRPYIERELTEMGGQEKIILRAPPGMTGMWQVSDRSATSFAQRCQIDVYYVRNWSPWLDIHILAKTFGVVIKGSGV